MRSLTPFTEDGPTLETVRRALGLSTEFIRERIGDYPQAQEAAHHFLIAVNVGAAVLGGGTPQLIEDEFIRCEPDSPLDEWTLRHAWLKVCEELSRVGERPSYGETVGLKRGLTARSSLAVRYAVITGQYDTRPHRAGATCGRCTRPRQERLLAALRRIR